jgi:hypothetical protein
VAALVAIFSTKDIVVTGRYVIVMTITTVCLLGPWWARNYKRFQSPVLTTLNVGESLYDGLNPKATGASDMSFTRDEKISAMSEKQRDMQWRRKAIAWAIDHPVRVLELAMIKFGRFWSPWPNEPRFQTPAVVATTTLYTLPMYVLALVGAIAGWKGTPTDRTLVLLVIIPTLYFCGLHMIFVSSVRYRVVILPLLSLLTALGGKSVWPREKRSPDGEPVHA